jgi:hypothetical protein
VPLVLLALRTLCLAFWFGGGIGAMLATTAIFRTARSRRDAGDLSGAVLRAAAIWRLAAAVPFLLTAAAPRGPGFWLGLAALVFAGTEWLVDARVRALRAELGGSTEGLAEGDPRRRRFGALHGVSVLLLLSHVLCAGAGVALS